MSETEHRIAPYALHRALDRPRSLDPPPPVESSVLHDLWAVVARRWRVIAATVVLFVGATAAYCLIATPYYRARATVLIDPRAPQILAGQRLLGEVQDPFTSAKYDYYQTQFNLLRSRSLVQRVIQELELADDPRFAAMGPAADKPRAQREPVLINQYLHALEILPLRGTRLVAVEFEAPDPDLAADIANTHARLFVRGGLERLYGAIEQIRGFLQTKLSELQARTQEAEERVLRFQSEHRLLPLDLSKDVQSERLADLSRRLTAAETERITLEAQYRLVAERGAGGHDDLPAVLTNGLIQRLREEYNGLEIEYALLAGKFRPTYPRLQQLGQQLARARALLQREVDKVVGGLEANYLAAQHTVDRLREEIEAQRRTLLERKDDEGELLTLTREAETTRALHDSLLARVKDLDITAGSDSSNINVAEPASPKLWPSTPDRPFLLTVSLLAGLLLGTGLAFLRDSFDRSIRDAHELRRVTGIGTLAVIPNFQVGLTEAPHAWLRSRAAQARRLAGRGWSLLSLRGLRNGATNGGRPAAIESADVTSVPSLLLGNGHVWRSAEAFRTLRTSLLLNPSGTIPRVVLITSAVGTEGKTTTAVNTAAALATCGVRILLIDGDLRLPRCHEALGVAAGPGLGDYLQWQRPDTEVIRPTRVENLFLLAAGGFVRNPTELLASWRMWKLVERVRNEFDFVVIDSPPLLAVSDGLLLANLADGVILVADRGRSRRDHVRVAMQKLLQTGVVPLGTVLNRGDVEFGYYRYNRPFERRREDAGEAVDAQPVPAPEQQA